MSAHANPGRIAAVQTLVECETGLHVDEALNRHVPTQTDNRRLAYYLALGALRRQGEVDAALRECLRDPLGGMDPVVRATLRIGAFECLFARTKMHAAVSQGVECVRQLGHGRAHGLVNAVLRRVRPKADLRRADRLNMPSWLLERWDDRYGEEDVERWCVRNTEAQPLVIATVHAKRLIREFESAGIEIGPVTLLGQPLTDVFYLIKGSFDVRKLPGYGDGLFWVQDPGAIACVDILPVENGMTVLDCCAAPGGKAIRMATRGGHVHGVDRNPSRIAGLESNVQRMGMKMSFDVHDWRWGPLPGNSEYDAVLVDAPCTGLGTIGRRPDIRWHRTPADLERMPAIQEKILKNAAQHASKGGYLLYSVCSPEPEEGPMIVDSFLSENPGFKLIRTLCTAPPEAIEDAHFAALLQRNLP